MTGDSSWWRDHRRHLIDLMQGRQHAFVYHLEGIGRCATQLASTSCLDRVFFACKANNHPEVLKQIVSAGLGLECTSQGELEHARQFCGASQLLFTPNFAARSEYEYALQMGAIVTLDGLHPLQHWPGLFSGQSLIVRVDLGSGKGHHAHVRTAGEGSKFGIEPADLPEMLRLAKAAGCRVIGLHSHAGSGITDHDHWADCAQLLADLAADIESIEILNLGGGLAVSSGEGGDDGIRLDRVLRSLDPIKQTLSGKQLWLEPGRFVVAQQGVLVARVTQIKEKGGEVFVGLSTGMNSLLRPALYQAWHGIHNLTRLTDSDVGRCHVVGPICESADRFGNDRLLPRSEEGDLVLISNAGAYAQTMASRYNLREPAEVLLL